MMPLNVKLGVCYYYKKGSYLKLHPKICNRRDLDEWKRMTLTVQPLTLAAGQNYTLERVGECHNTVKGLTSNRYTIVSGGLNMHPVLLDDEWSA